MLELTGNLFRSKYIEQPNTMIVHCISADYVLGKGFAAEVERRYKVRSYLNTVGTHTYPDVIPVDNILNLVTKERYYNKPTYETLRECLIMTREYCLNNNITNLVMPTIGCGLDKLDWRYVREDIKYILDEFDINCIVYKI
jgi:hypothetical protein